jgi:hypothetical protein
MDDLTQIITPILPFLIATGQISPLIGLFLVPFFILIVKKISKLNWLIRRSNKSVSITVYNTRLEKCNFHLNNHIYYYLAWYLTQLKKMKQVQYSCDETTIALISAQNSGDCDTIPQYKIDSCEDFEISYNNQNITVSFGFDNKSEKKTINSIILTGNSFELLETFIQKVSTEYNKYSKNTRKEIRSYYYDFQWKARIIYTSKTIDNLFLHNDVYHEIFDKIDVFKNSQDFYKKAGVSYKKGFLFYGRSGLGKTSVVYAISNYLNYGIYRLHLNSFTDRKKLIEAASTIPINSIVLIDDIDVIKSTNKRRTKKIKMDLETYNLLNISLYSDLTFFYDSNVNDDKTLCKIRLREEEYTKVLEFVNSKIDDFLNFTKRDFSSYIVESDKEETDGLVLSDLLEIFDGNEYFHGCIIIFISNYPDKLDPALIRSGRIDSKVQFLPADKKIITKVFQYFYKDFNPDNLDIINENFTITQAELINTIILPHIDNMSNAINLLTQI